MNDAERLAIAHAALNRIDRLTRALNDSPNDDVDQQIQMAIYEAVACGTLGQPLPPVTGEVAGLLPNRDSVTALSS